MDIIAELLTPANLLKPESATKDRQQSHKRYKQLQSVQNEDDAKQIVGAKAVSWDHVERRSGIDRREHNNCRGRWLESREEKDRRQLAKAISVTI